MNVAHIPLERMAECAFSCAPFMIYPFLKLDLKAALLIVGLLLIVAHGFALLQPKTTQEFARALGMIVLLIAEPLLEAGFLRPEWAKLALNTLVYVWICFGLFWIGMPYTLRDQIAWLSKDESRWKSAAFAGIGYGVILLI